MGFRWVTHRPRLEGTIFFGSLLPFSQLPRQWLFSAPFSSVVFFSLSAAHFGGFLPSGCRLPLLLRRLFFVTNLYLLHPTISLCLHCEGFGALVTSATSGCARHSGGTPPSLLGNSNPTQGAQEPLPIAARHHATSALFIPAF